MVLANPTRKLFCSCIIAVGLEYSCLPYFQGWAELYIYTLLQGPYTTVYLVISLPKIPYIQRIYMVLANSTVTYFLC